MRHVSTGLSFLVIAGALVCGCSRGPHLVEVTGTVTMNGKAIGNVRVDFHPDPDKKNTGQGSSGTTDENGKFKLMFANGKPGAIVGHHRVILTDLDVFGNVLVGRGEYRRDDDKGPVEVAKKPRFAEKYSDLAKTPFSEEVKPGMSPVSYDIK